MSKDDADREERRKILSQLKASLRDHTDTPGLADLLRRKAELDDEIQEKFFRVRTIVDMDVAGSARMKENENPQDVFITFTAYQDLAKTAVESNGGQIASTAGDGITAIFDNPNSAQDAAAAIIEGLEKFNKKSNKLHTPIQLRIGVHTGSMIYDPDGDLGGITDETVDIANQIQKECQPGNMLITENTYKLLRDLAAFEILRYWEDKRIHIYGYKKAARAAEADSIASIPASYLEDLPALRVTPVIDPLLGIAAHNLTPGLRVWMKRTETLYAESFVHSVKSVGGGHSLIVVYMAGGGQAWAYLEDMLKICCADDRAQALAEQVRGVKAHLKRLGTNETPSFKPAFTIKWVLVGVVAVLAILLVAMLFKII